MFFNKKGLDLINILENITIYKGNDIEYLIDLVQYLRPKNKKDFGRIDEKITSLINILRENPQFLHSIKDYLIRVLKNKTYGSVITDSNMMADTEFWGELVTRVMLKILPKQPNKNSIEHLISNVFYKETDIKWIKKITIEKRLELIELLSFSRFYELKNNNHFIQELLYSVDVLIHRLSGHAFDSNILKLVPEYNKLNNPFTGLHLDLGSYLKDLSNELITRSPDELHYKQAYSNISIYGISFKAHQQLLLMERLLTRLKKVLSYVVIDNKVTETQKITEIVVGLIEFDSGNSKIRDFIYNSTQNISKEITRSIGSKGETYITVKRSEYFKMFKTALGGGFLVAFACFIKMNMGAIPASLFGKAFMYSANYVWVFVAIYLFNLTLATKQPAMTASTLAKAIESDYLNKNNFENLALLFSRIWRSQFIAFLGNVVMAIATATLIMTIWYFIFNSNPAEDKAYVMFKNLNLLDSRLIFHAAIAGVFLFFSGLISGYTTNRTKFNNLALRIQDHPLLRQIFSFKTREKFANYLHENIGGIVSNFWFGIFMGSTVVVGMFLGLDLDIRHITFAAGNFALALFGQNFTTSTYDVLMSILGIGIIGFVNFFVSFTLSLLLALRSRGIPFRTVLSIFKSILKYFKKYPGSFILPLERK
jgi:site-specific recombinase